MNRSSVYFPWRIFRWFVFYQWTWMIVLLGIFFLLEYLNFTTIDDAVLRAEKLKTLIVTISVCCALFLGVTLLLSRRLLIPLGHLIERTRRLRKSPFQSSEFTIEELAVQEAGEWYELETAINKLGREFRNKTIRLSREKTELRAIMSAMDEAVLAIDRLNQPLFYNNQFAYLFRLERWDRKKTGLGEIIRSPEVVEGIQQTLSQGEGHQKYIDYILPGSSHKSYFRVSFTPLSKKHNSEIYGVVIILHDLTSIRASEKVRIDFVANASHELRTPVTSLKGYLQTLKEDVQSGRFEDAIHFIEIIERNVSRLSSLLDDLLDLSQMDLGVEVKRRTISTRDLTENVLQQIDGRYHEIKTIFSVEEFEADPARVEQVLRNLIQNAIRYVPRGGLIEVVWEANSEGHTVLRVRDTGPGIPEVHLSRLFERFYRVDTGRARDKGGTGIGLSLVKHIMQAHGGSVSVKSRVGEGSEFICQF